MKLCRIMWLSENHSLSWHWLSSYQQCSIHTLFRHQMPIFEIIMLRTTDIKCLKYKYWKYWRMKSPLGRKTQEINTTHIRLQLLDHRTLSSDSQSMGDWFRHCSASFCNKRAHPYQTASPSALQISGTGSAFFIEAPLLDVCIKNAVPFPMLSPRPRPLCSHSSALQSSCSPIGSPSTSATMVLARFQKGPRWNHPGSHLSHPTADLAETSGANWRPGRRPSRSTSRFFVELGSMDYETVNGRDH